MNPTSYISALALATVTATSLTSVALAQETTPPAFEARLGMKHGRGGMMGPAGFDFEALDADRDGSVTKAELDAYRAARAAEIDADGDGFLSAEELAAMHIRAFTERANDMAARMVAQMDADKDGKLSAAEMASRPGPELLFDRIDADGDGTVTQAEVDAAKARMMERGGDRGGKHGPRGGHEGRGWGFGWFGGDDAGETGN